VRAGGKADSQPQVTCKSIPEDLCRPEQHSYKVQASAQCGVL